MLDVPSSMQRCELTKPVYALLLLSSFTLTLILSRNLTQRPAVTP